MHDIQDKTKVTFIENLFDVIFIRIRKLTCFATIIKMLILRQTKLTSDLIYPTLLVVNFTNVVCAGFFFVLKLYVQLLCTYNSSWCFLTKFLCPAMYYIVTIKKFVLFLPEEKAVSKMLVKLATDFINRSKMSKFLFSALT